MLLEILDLHEDSDLERLLVAACRADAAASANLEWANRSSSGSSMAPDVLARSIAASLRLAGIPATASDVSGMLSGEMPVPDPVLSGAIRGLADAMHAALDRPDELPLSESQLKYLQSLILRHDPLAASFRRQYRREGADVETLPSEVARLVAWSRSSLEAAASSPTGVLPVVIVAAFALRLSELRPFSVGTGRLARVVVAQLLVRYGHRGLLHESLDEAIEARAEGFASARDRRDSVGWIALLLEAFAACSSAAAARFESVAERTAPIAVVPAGFSRLLSPRQERVLAAMRERGVAKIGDLLPVLAIPRATLKKDLRALIDGGLLQSSGERKGTVYRVLPDSLPAD